MKSKRERSGFMIMEVHNFFRYGYKQLKSLEYVHPESAVGVFLSK